MKTLTAVTTLALKAFWLGCLVLAFGQNAQATPPCHEMAEPVSGCEWCLVSAETLDQTADVISALTVLASSADLILVVADFVLPALESQAYTVAVPRGPPDQIFTATDWFSDTIRLRL